MVCPALGDMALFMVISFKVKVGITEDEIDDRRGGPRDPVG